MDSSMSIFLLVFILPVALVFLIFLFDILAHRRTWRIARERRKVLQYSYYTLRDMARWECTALRDDVVHTVTRCWLSSLGDMEAYRRYCTYDDTYEQALGIHFSIETGGDPTAVGTRLILLLRPQERTVNDIERLLSNMGWERDVLQVHAPDPKEERPRLQSGRQYTDDGYSLYRENGDE